MYANRSKPRIIGEGIAWGQNILGITIKSGDIVIPLNTRFVSKQGRGRTKKPVLFVAMMKEVLDFFDAHSIDIRKYPITFDSWYGSKKLIDILLNLGFVSILVHGKNNYVMTIKNKRLKLSVHKKSGQLQPKQWGAINLSVVSKPQVQHLVSVLCSSFQIWERDAHS